MYPLIFVKSILLSTIASTEIKGIPESYNSGVSCGPSVIGCSSSSPNLRCSQGYVESKSSILVINYKTKKSRSDLIRTGFSPTLYSFLPCQHVHSLFSRDSTSTCLKQREDSVSGGLPGFARSGLPCPGLRSCRCSRRWRGGVFCRFPGRR